MTHVLIRRMAKELAGAFYEESSRTPGFRGAFPTVKAYLLGRWHHSDGRVTQDTPGWLHHVALARQCLALMLGQDSVPEAYKGEISEALIEDWHQAMGGGAKNITQRLSQH